MPQIIQNHFCKVTLNEQKTVRLTEINYIKIISNINLITAASPRKHACQLKGPPDPGVTRTGLKEQQD